MEKWHASVWFVLALGLMIASATPVCPQTKAYMRVGYVVHNQASRSINVNVSTDNRNWRTHHIDPDATRTFDCSQCPNMMIRTTLDDGGSRQVSYRMNCGERYVINWNDSKSCWDVFTATGP